MRRELFWLTLTVAMTGLMWIPYILDRIAVRGVMGTLSNPSAADASQSGWAQRLMAAHMNAIENLIIFAPLVVITQLLNISTRVSGLACALYFWSRLAHAIVYTIGSPVVRTLAFFGGFIAQVILVLAIFKLV
jgi:uncharacterized MAPEG superfamily protein